MHAYATDSKERKNVVFAIAVLSVVVAYGLHLALRWLRVEMPWWIDAPSVMAVFGVLYELFEKRLWRMPVFQITGIVKIPDLNGMWDGEGRTSFDGAQYRAQVTIKQTWTSISIFLETEHSTSRSLTASLLVEQPEGPTLSYEYRNEPKPIALPTMHSHRGTATLRLKNNGVLEGEYYSGRDRQNYGNLMLKRTTYAR